MQIFSLVFFAFFAVVFAVYWCAPRSFRLPVLLLASCAFYAPFGAGFLLLLLVMGLLAWGGGIALEKRRTKPVLGVALLVCLAPLLLFKYFNFLSDSFVALSGLLHVSFSPLYLKWGAPAGISYYTFLMVSYLVDIYRQKCAAERNPILCVTSFSLFLQITAGPLTRPCDLLPQLRAARTFDTRQALGGAQLVAFGLFKKLALAQTLSSFAEPVFYDPQKLHGMSIIIAVFLYAVQIYADFSGYTDVARGLGRMLGFELSENFRSPYFSQSIKEFWARWHISLSSWLKDYIYIPLGGSRVCKARHLLNLFLTFVVSGLWHGASVPMLLWGCVHGLYMMVGTLTRPVRDRLWSSVLKPLTFLRAPLAILVTFLLVCFSWIFFACSTTDNITYIITHLFYDFQPTVSYLKESIVLLGLTTSACVRIAVMILAVVAVDVCKRQEDYAAWMARQKSWVQVCVSYVWMAGIILWGSIGAGSTMYFAF